MSEANDSRTPRRRHSGVQSNGAPKSRENQSNKNKQPQEPNNQRRQKGSTRSVKYVKLEKERPALTRDLSNPERKRSHRKRGSSSEQKQRDAHLKIIPLGGLDAIVFTAGVGENQCDLRREILESLAYLGVTINEEANNTRRTEIEISGADSTVKAYVIPTNEELVIARDTKAIVEAL